MAARVELLKHTWADMMGKTRKSENLLSQVQEGMIVFDVNKQRVGAISDIYFGDTADEFSRAKAEQTTISHDLGTLPGTETAQTSAIPTVPADNTDTNETVSTGFQFENGLSESIRARLSVQGFVRVKGGGLLPTVYYITPDQLDSLNVRDVYLSVTCDQLTNSGIGLLG